MHVINFLCVLATPVICVVAHHPNGRSPPFFLTPRKGHGARARPSGPRPRASWKGGVKKRGTFPIWMIRHLCQQFQLSNNVSSMANLSVLMCQCQHANGQLESAVNQTNPVDKQLVGKILSHSDHRLLKSRLFS